DYYCTSFVGTNMLF
nr:immunoglobulin light chain junction region [Macaca mulatta]